jgi:transcriptional regulator with XRE-family HTH domain
MPLALPARFLMAARKLSNYLRMYRKRSGLSQCEAAFLLGCSTGTKLSRYEHCARRPNLDSVFACEAVLGAPARELSAGEYQKVEDEAGRRAEILDDKLRRRKLDAINQRKREALWAIRCGWGLEPA